MPHSHLISNTGKNTYRTVIAVSGGLDSNAVLYRRLIDTDDEIIVMHLEILRSWDNRHFVETAAFQNCLKEIKRLTRGPSEVVTYKVTPPICDEPDAEPGFPLDHELVNIYGAWLCRFRQADKFLIGRTLTEDSMPGLRKAAVQAERQFHAVAQDLSCVVEYPLRYTHKRELWDDDFVPAVIRDKTLQCRRPIVGEYEGWIDCGECFACKRRQEAKAGVDPVQTIQLEKAC